jgi:hypothetical protein
MSLMLLLVSLFAACLAGEHLNALRALPAVALQGETHHVQGIDVHDATLWVSSVDAKSKRGWVFVFDRSTGKLKHSVEVQSGDRFHPGGLSRDGSSIWVPVAEYRRSSTTNIQKRHAGTLALQTEFAVNDHIGAVAVVKDQLVGANWDAREFYVWSKSGREIRKVANPTGVAIQDMKYVNGTLVAGGLRKDKSGVVVWLEWPGLKTLRTLETGRTDRGVTFTQEGLAVQDRTLYLLPEDGPSRLFGFVMDGATVK